MKRQRIGRSSSQRSYQSQLLHAMGEFLPHRGLTLEATGTRLRWTDRLLVVLAILMTWQVAATVKDAFEACWYCLRSMYPTRRRAGYTYQGFIKALMARSAGLLGTVVEALRSGIRRVAPEDWQIEGWVVMGVDGSKIQCPRTHANEQAFGSAGKANGAPQQSVTTVLHVGTGLIWDWRRGGGNEVERGHLWEMIEALPPAALLLADAGFTGYELLKRLLAGGRSFIIRAGSNVRLLRKLGYMTREGEGIVSLWPQAARRDNEPLTLRLVVVHDGRKPVYLLTNVLDESVLSDAQVGRMYRLRWGIEVFYRSLKRTMEKHRLRSRSPRQAEVEMDWALVGLWMLGLLTVQRMATNGREAQGWSVAKSLRTVRRVMAGQGNRYEARNLWALGRAGKDSYRRRGPKAIRRWPRKKREAPPGAPKIRVATPQERRQAQAFHRKKAAA